MTDKPTTEEAIKEWNKRGHHYEHADKPTQNEQAIAALEKIRTAFCLLPQKLQSEQYQAYLEIQSALTDAVVIDAPIEEPTAWKYELATAKDSMGLYTSWCQCLTGYKPNVPEGSVRNLTPLYAQGRTKAVPDGWNLVPIEVIEDTLHYVGKECYFDHHGYCQAHGLQEKEDCFAGKLNTALSAAPPVTGGAWLPIESAPRDIPVLACNSANGCIDIIQLDTPVDWRYAAPPTHWQHLPEPKKD